jgi:hypothetical protein
VIEIDSILWWSGIIPWAVVAYIAFAIAREILLGFVSAVDWFIWVFKCCKLNGRRLYWRALPLAFFSIWWQLTGAASGSKMYHAMGGEWRGFRDWDVHKIGAEL